MHNNVAIVEEILGDADALIRQRQKERGFEFPHLVVAVTPDGQVILRSNVSPANVTGCGRAFSVRSDELVAETVSPCMAHRAEF